MPFVGDKSTKNSGFIVNKFKKLLHYFLFCDKILYRYLHLAEHSATQKGIHKMKFFKAVKDLVCYGSVYFTAITTVMLLLALDNTGKAPDTGRFLLFLLLSFIFATGSLIYSIKAINRPLAATLHAAIYNIGFLIFMIACGMDFVKSIIGTLAFAICYTVITVTYRLIKGRVTKASEKSASAEVSQKPTKEKKTAPKKEENGGYTNLFS